MTALEPHSALCQIHREHLVASAVTTAMRPDVSLRAAQGALREGAGPA